MTTNEIQLLNAKSYKTIHFIPIKYIEDLILFEDLHFSFVS